MLIMFIFTLSNYIRFYNSYRSCFLDINISSFIYDPRLIQCYISACNLSLMTTQLLKIYISTYHYPLSTYH